MHFEQLNVKDYRENPDDVMYKDSSEDEYPDIDDTELKEMYMNIVTQAEANINS